MKTRTKKSTTTNGSGKGSEPTQRQAALLPPSLDEAPRVLVLPKGIARDARFITLPHYSSPDRSCRYLICPDTGAFEITTIGDKKSCQSWLCTPNDLTRSEEKEALILKDPYLLVCTPIDPLFLIVPMMTAADSACPGMFRTVTDILYDDATAQWQDMRLLTDTKFGNVQRLLESRMALASDKLDLGDGEDATYKLSMPKLARAVLAKAVRSSRSSFPASMEDRFVRQALELPQHDIISSIAVPDVIVSDHDSSADGQSQDSITSGSTVVSTSTAATSMSISSAPTRDTDDDIKRLLRIRTTYDFMVRSYVPRTLHKHLGDALGTMSDVVDFAPLVHHEEYLAQKRSEVQALRTLSDNISRKRQVDDEEAMEKAETKRRKKEEEETKKKSMSQGVKKLLKADTSGMKKLSSFFTKK